MQQHDRHQIYVPELDQTFYAESDECILDAALKAGVELPFGCRMGMCRACMVKVVGEAEHDVDMPALGDDEIEAGYRLICCSRPRSDLILHYEVE